MIKDKDQDLNKAGFFLAKDSEEQGASKRILSKEIEEEKEEASATIEQELMIPKRDKLKRKEETREGLISTQTKEEKLFINSARKKDLVPGAAAKSKVKEEDEGERTKGGINEEESIKTKSPKLWAREEPKEKEAGTESIKKAESQKGTGEKEILFSDKKEETEEGEDRREFTFKHFLGFVENEDKKASNSLEERIEE